ncbi:MAG: hypothetical protein K6F35_10065 [Lachnospiraceae bacterium]|nr:hypothetical protein [Lachnospiraceae bacterium]
MKRNWKRILSLILVFCLILGLDQAVFAAEGLALPCEEETEKAEGAESEPGRVPSDTDFGGVTVEYEMHGSVVSDNRGNLTIRKGTIAALRGTSTKPIRVTLEDDAQVYVGADFYMPWDKDDRNAIEVSYGESLKNVEFDGTGSIYILRSIKRTDSLSVNAANIINLHCYRADPFRVGAITVPDGAFVLSVNNAYRHCVNDQDVDPYEAPSEEEGYDRASFTGLRGRMEVYDLNERDINDGLAKSVLAESESISVNEGLSIYKNGSYVKNLTRLRAGEDGDFDFGSLIIYRKDGEQKFYYTNMPVKPAKPDVSTVTGHGEALMEGAWRLQGIDLDEAAAYAIDKDEDGKDLNDDEIEYVISGTEEIPAVTAAGWKGYIRGSHTVFDSMADGTSKIQENKTYYLFARSIKGADHLNPDQNEGFFSDGILVGSFETKETPDRETGKGVSIPEELEITYMGDASAYWLNKNGTVLTNSSFLDQVSFKDKDGSETKRLKLGVDNRNDGRTLLNGNKYASLAVTIDGTTVGELHTCFIKASEENTRNKVQAMSREELEAASQETLDGLVSLREGTADLRHLNAGTYYVKALFEAYHTDGYTGNPGFAGREDLPYQTASSNVAVLTVKKANLTVVPAIDPDFSMKDKDGNSVWDDNYYAYSADPEYETLSGNRLTIGAYAYDPDKAYDGETPYTRVSSPVPFVYFDRVQQGLYSRQNVIQDARILFDGKTLEEYRGRTDVISSDGEEPKTYAFKVKENSLRFFDDSVSGNFNLTYLENTITAVHEDPGETVSYNFVGFGGRAYYGSTLKAVQKRVYYEYASEETSGYRIIYWNAPNQLGDGVYRNASMSPASRIKDDAEMAEVEPGTTVYVSANKVRIYETNETLTGQAIPVLIETRPLDVYAHAYPYRGEEFKGEIEPVEVYGDIHIDNYDSTGMYYGYDSDHYYFDGKRGFFQGEDLLSASVKAKDAKKVKTIEPTIVWDDEDGQYEDDPFKLYLDLKTGQKAGEDGKGSDPQLSERLADRFYIHTAVCYVTVQPKITVNYILQYEDPRKDREKGEKLPKDKLVATEEYKFDHTRIYEGLDNRQNIPVVPSHNEEVKGWTKKGDGVLNEEDGDHIAGWYYGTINGKWQLLDADPGYDDSNFLPATEDYFVYAMVYAYAGNDVYIGSIPPVEYTGLAHVMMEGTNNTDNYYIPAVKSSQVDDLEITVMRGTVPLIYGKDFKLSYKNNTNASVYYSNGGKTLADKVKPIYKKKGDKPQVVITGAGRYAGKFKATVYFDIYPAQIRGDLSRPADKSRVYIESLEQYYDPWDVAGEEEHDDMSFPAVAGIKDSYFAANNKAAKVSYKVQNVHYPSRTELVGHADSLDPYYKGVIRDEDKPKITTLKKGADYAETIYRIDGANDKNEEDMGRIAVAAKDIKPGYDYYIEARGIGNYTGYAYSRIFHVYDSKSYGSLEGLKLSIPSTLKWESLMLDEDNALRNQIRFNDLKIAAASKKKSGSGKTVTLTGTMKVDIYKIKKSGVIERKVISWDPGTGSEKYEGIFDDAGLYKLVLWGPFTETVTQKKKGKLSATYKQYTGRLEKNLTIKGIQLKSGDFKLSWKSKAWSGKSDEQKLTFSKGIYGKLKKNKFGKNMINQTYVDAYLQRGPGRSKYTWEPYYNKEDKRFEAYIRDYVRRNDKADSRQAAEEVAGNAAGFFGDVYYTDNGSRWTVGEQLDVYRFVFTSGMHNKDVGKYTIRIPTDGIFGTDGLKLYYNRTGTATKILVVEE